jgi:hypothetical protein
MYTNSWQIIIKFECKYIYDILSGDSCKERRSCLLKLSDSKSVTSILKRVDGVLILLLRYGSLYP